MQDTELAFTPAWRLKELLDSKELSPVELTEVYLRRIEALDGQLHSFLTVSGDEARASAKEAEQKIARGETGALLGLPVAIKDLEMTKGIRSTMGSLVFSETIPDQDSALVEAGPFRWWNNPRQDQHPRIRLGGHHREQAWPALPKSLGR